MIEIPVSTDPQIAPISASTISPLIEWTLAGTDTQPARTKACEKQEIAVKRLARGTMVALVSPGDLPLPPVRSPIGRPKPSRPLYRPDLPVGKLHRIARLFVCKPLSPCWR